MSDEKNVVYVARLHWVLFFWPSLFLLIAMFLLIQFQGWRELGLIFLVFSLIWWAMTWVLYQFSSLAIEAKRVIFRTGFLVRKTTDITYSKIETLDVRQSLLGSILGYGAFMVTGSGGSRHFINLLAHPLTCRRYIEEMMNRE